MEDNNRVLTKNGLVIDPDNFSVTIKGQRLELTYNEFQLLELLVRYSGKVFSRQEIIEYNAGKDYIVTERSVDVKIAGLRKKLGSHSNIIKTVRSVGYRFDEA